MYCELALEAAFRRLLRVEPLAGDPGALLAVGPARHRGRPVTLADGTEIRAGDLLAECHFRAEALAALGREADPVRLGVGVRRLLKGDLPRLARWLPEHPRLREARALHAITPFHAAAPRLGFEARELENTLARWWFSAWQRFLLRRLHPAGAARLARRGGEPVFSRQVWMSRARLEERWGGGS